MANDQYNQDYPFFINHLARERTAEGRVIDTLRAYDQFIRPLGLPGGSTVLDIGACTGSLMNKLNWLGDYQMYGIDLNEAAIEAGKFANSDLNLSVASAEILPFARGSFDAVISQDLLEHIHPQNLSQVLKEFRRVGRGGRMVHKVTVLEDTDWIDADETHQTKETAMWWVRLFNKNGYRVLSNPTKAYLDRWKFLPVTKLMYGYFVLEPL